MDLNDVMPLSFDERFIKLGPVDYVCFGPYFYELKFGRDYFIRFLSKTFVEKNGVRQFLSTPESNYLFSGLVSVRPLKYQEFEYRVEISMDNNVKIICDTTIEQKCFNFQMKIPGAGGIIEW